MRSMIAMKKPTIGLRKVSIKGKEILNFNTAQAVKTIKGGI